MKKLILISIFALYALIDINAQTFTTGHYRSGNFRFSGYSNLSLNGQTVTQPIDSFKNPKYVRELLNLAGVHNDSIISIFSYGDSANGIFEVFFAFKGQLSPNNLDISMGHGKKYVLGYTSTNGIIAPYFNKLPADSLKSTIEFLYKNYEVYSFMVRNVTILEMVPYIISREPVNGKLADMRNIPDSYIYLETFKRLNWATIWVKDKNGKVKSYSRPRGMGW
jgi:hypothetical protein